LGGDGDDKLFVGAGADQFWIVSAELPAAANRIVDFQIGKDVIGMQGAQSLGIDASKLDLVQLGADTSIAFGGKTLATLNGIQSSSLNLGDSSQFVFT
jgi:Ca2+-binding RTX toxin-like protein